MSSFQASQSCRSLESPFSAAGDYKRTLVCASSPSTGGIGAPLDSARVKFQLNKLWYFGASRVLKQLASRGFPMIQIMIGCDDSFKFNGVRLETPKYLLKPVCIPTFVRQVRLPMPGKRLTRHLGLNG
jgi:hypothetical protein